MVPLFPPSAKINFDFFAASVYQLSQMHAPFAFVLHSIPFFKIWQLASKVKSSAPSCGNCQNKTFPNSRGLVKKLAYASDFTNVVQKCTN